METLYYKSPPSPTPALVARALERPVVRPLSASLALRARLGDVEQVHDALLMLIPQTDGVALGGLRAVRGQHQVLALGFLGAFLAVLRGEFDAEKGLLEVGHAEWQGVADGLLALRVDLDKLQELVGVDQGSAAEGAAVLVLPERETC